MLPVSDKFHTYNVERIRNPETNEIPCSPLSTLRLHCDFINRRTRPSEIQLLLTRLQIKVVQHQLCVGQAWLRRNRYFVCEIREPRVFELLHGGSDVS